MKTTAPEKKEKPFKSIFVAAMAHPVRVKCLARMGEAETSPSAIARELRMNASQVGYHVRALHSYDLIEIVEERPVRGAVEHIYRAAVVPVITEEDYFRLSPDKRIGYVETLLSLYAADATYSLETGTLLNRGDWHIARTAMTVDQQGWSDISAVYEEAYGRIAEIKSECEERIRRDDERPKMRILSFQSLFELPPMHRPKRRPR
ncbi:MAG TPA: helix-turn-helix domain-containing protein [Solirubrobacterales bacterium]|jgi:DNA-binding transcriptional ArsR family regulator